MSPSYRQLELLSQQLHQAHRSAVSAGLSARGLEWSKHERIWIQSEQMYQTIYEFEYTEKRRL